MAYAAFCLTISTHAVLQSHNQLFPSVSSTPFSGTLRLSTEMRAAKKIFHRRCLGGTSQSSVPVTQTRGEKAVEKEGKFIGAAKVSELNDKLKRQLDIVRNKIHTIGDGDQISMSAYDTAWVALVQDIDGNDAPQFPSSLDWINNNQLPDGSWGDRNYFAIFDRLNNTLACVLALTKWNINSDGREKGITYLRQNIHKLKDEDPQHVVGFHITFPSLLEVAQTLGLQVFEDSNVWKELIAKKDLILARIPKELIHTVPTKVQYNLEGIPDVDWEKIIKLQHPNGSFLCSPSSTAHAFMQTKDEKCFKYLNQLVQKYNGGAPFSYPHDLFERLWLVDRLERLGFSRYFKSEIKGHLDHVNRYWTPNGISWARESNLMDADDSAHGFRLLRRHGYDVKASLFEQFKRDGQFYCFVGEPYQGPTEMLSLYRASQVLFPNEQILEEAKKFCSNFLREKLESKQVSDRWVITKDLAGEVQYHVEVPWYASLPRVETRYYIDQYGGDDDVWIAKVLYRMHIVCADIYLELAKLDYDHCQNLHQLEWMSMLKWYEDHNLREFCLSKDDLLKFYFIAMSSIFEPEQATERLAWAQTTALMEMISIYFKEKSVDQKKAFCLAFTSCVNNGTFDSNGTRNGLVEVIHKTLSDISSKVQHVHGKDVLRDLNDAWNAWLQKFEIQGNNNTNMVPDDEAELIVNTINLCAGHLLPQSEYTHLTSLTNGICNYLHQIENVKAGKTTKNITEETNLPIESIDVQMQELVQHVVKYNSGVDQEIKQTFLAVAKSYYYTAHFDRTTIDIHIAKVLFERVV